VLPEFWVEPQTFENKLERFFFVGFFKALGEGLAHYGTCIWVTDLRCHK